MKEKEQSKEIQFFKTAEAKKDQKRKRNCSTFFEKRKEKSFQKEQNYVLSECKDYLKKAFSKEDSKTL